jgi:hypothetical protein
MAAKHTISLVSLPFRVAAAVGFAALGHYAPEVGVVVLVLVLLASGATLVVSAVLLRLVRTRARRDCSACDFRPLRAARICPRCKTSTLAGAVAGMPRHVRRSVLEVAVAAAWDADQLGAAEGAFVSTLIRGSELPDDEQRRLEKLLQEGLTVDAVDVGGVGTHGLRALELAASVLTVNDDEPDLDSGRYPLLAARLGVPRRRAIRALKQQRAGAYL